MLSCCTGRSPCDRVDVSVARKDAPTESIRGEVEMTYPSCDLANRLDDTLFLQMGQLLRCEAEKLAINFLIMLTERLTEPVGFSWSRTELGHDSGKAHRPRVALRYGNLVGLDHL